MPRALESLRSSGRITLSDLLPDDSVIGSSWGGVFYHPAFVKAGRDVLGLEGTASRIEHDGNPIGALNLLSRERASIRTATTPLLFQYFGPLLSQTSFSRSYWRDIDDYLSEVCDFAHFSFPPTPQPIDQLARGWRVKESFTIAILCNELQAWGSGFRDDVRNKIKKAGKERVRIAQIDRLPQDLWSKSYARRNVQPPIKPALLEQWCVSLIRASLLRIYAASIDDVTVAFRGELVLGEYAYDWIAGSDSAYHSTGANQLLMAQIGEELKNRNLQAWDLVGAEIKSIADFKKSFGAREIRHYHLSRAFNFKGKMFALLRNLKHGR